MNETPLAPGISFHSWRKASRSTAQGSCVEVGMWRKSARSGQGAEACVEIAEYATGGIAVRDSKDPAGPKLRFQAGEWSYFLDHIKSGSFVLR